MARSRGQIPRSPERDSRHFVAVRHPETGHRVEDFARQLNLNSLSIQGSTSHTSTDERLVSVHGILDRAARAVTGLRVPLAPPQFSDRANVAIPFPQCGRRVPAELGVTARWDEHAHRSSFAAFMDGSVSSLGVVRAVCRDRCDGVTNLLKQCRDSATVMRPASGQIGCEDLTAIGIHSEVQLAPSPSLRRFP